MMVFIVIATESCKFKSNDPIVFETSEEAAEYIEHRKISDELEGVSYQYDRFICKVNSKSKRQATLAAIREKMGDKNH